MNKKLVPKTLQAVSRNSVNSQSHRLRGNLRAGVLLAAVASSTPSFADQTNLLVNGDFEDPPLPCRLWVAVPEGSGFITGWNINVASTNSANGGCDSFPYYSHSVDVLFCTSGPYYAHTGHQAIDMAGTYSAPGDSIYQDVPTRPGRTYILTFHTSSNVDPISNGLTIEWNDVPIDTISTPVQGQWTEHSYSVQATSEVSRLRFVGNIGGGQGSFLDTVSLVGDADVDEEPPVVSCPPGLTVPVGNVPPAATSVADFTGQGGSISDNQDPNPSVVSSDEVSGSCPTLVTRTYTVTDAAGNSTQCQQLITVQGQFADEGIIWYSPLARFDKSIRTDASKCVFNHGCTIPVKIRVRGCDGTDLTRNPNIIGTLEVLALSDCNDPSTGHPVPIEHNGGDGAVMVKAGGFLRYNLNTRRLPADTHCYLLKATVIDVTTGESLSETLPMRCR